MRHDPASGAVIIMLRSLKMHGMAQAVTDLIEQGAPAFEAAVPILTQLLKAEMEAGHGRSSRTQRDPASIEALGPGTLAELERVPPAQQGRDENELREAARPAADVPAIRPPGGGGPDPGGGLQPLHGTRHPDDRGRRISVPGERGSARRAGRVPHGSILSDIFYRGWVSSQ